MKTKISREIGIDVGHRVPDHGSKCRNPHGHRYRVIANCSGNVVNQSGHEENGMVIDFGNIKTYMMDIIDAVFDHGFVVYKGDNAMVNMFLGDDAPPQTLKKIEYFSDTWNFLLQQYVENVKKGRKPTSLHLPRCGVSHQDPDGLKVIFVDYVPTAENLAKHMYEMLEPVIKAHYGNDTIWLEGITLYETPNGWVEYTKNSVTVSD